MNNPEHRSRLENICENDKNDISDEAENDDQIMCNFVDQAVLNIYHETSDSDSVDTVSNLKTDTYYKLDSETKRNTNQVYPCCDKRSNYIEGKAYAVKSYDDILESPMTKNIDDINFNSVNDKHNDCRNIYGFVRQKKNYIYRTRISKNLRQEIITKNRNYDENTSRVKNNLNHGPKARFIEDSKNKKKAKKISIDKKVLEYLKYKNKAKIITDKNIIDLVEPAFETDVPLWSNDAYYKEMIKRCQESLIDFNDYDVNHIVPEPDWTYKPSKNKNGILKPRSDFYQRIEPVKRKKEHITLDEQETTAKKCRTNKSSDGDLVKNSNAQEANHSSPLVIRKTPFQNLVRKIAKKIDPRIQFESQAIYVLQETCEAYIISIFEDALLSTKEAKRRTLMPIDIRNAKELEKIIDNRTNLGVNSVRYSQKLLREMHKLMDNKNN